MPTPAVEPIIPAPVETSAAPPFSLKIKVEIETIVVPERDGRFSVLVPALPGCFSQGDTIDEVRANAIEATELWLECAHEENARRALEDATA